MMKRTVFAVVLLIFLLTPALKAAAQNRTDSSTTTVFDTSNLPQWVKDMRRFDIITFGSFPFSMFVVTFITDMVRWQNANNFDFSDAGRRYAPWPLKTAGAVEMTGQEYQRTILLSFGLSAAAALVDLLIVKIKQRNERRRLESMPSGSVNINRGPYENAGEAEDSGGTDTDDGDTDIADNEPALE